MDSILLLEMIKYNNTDINSNEVIEKAVTPENLEKW